jgi:hypothetical protein
MKSRKRLTVATRLIVPAILVGAFALVMVARLHGQSIEPYPNAVSDQLVHPKTLMGPPAANVPFRDPDFGSEMVRVTDENSNIKRSGIYLRTEASGNANMWSSDSSKFYVIAEGGSAYAYSFNPSNMRVGSLPGAAAGQPLVLPLRPGASFSLTDPDLMYGTVNATPLTISSFRFSTGITSTVIDTTTCGVQPPLMPGPLVRSDYDVTPSLDERRISISEGGPAFDQHMFVIVYDKSLGCRWYNTQTGQIGGQWGPTGGASTSDSYLIGHAYLSRSGNYVRIGAPGFGWYVWDVASLKVKSCRYFSDLHCFGYTAMGYDSLVQNRGFMDPMDIVKRSFDDLAQVTPLVSSFPVPPAWEQEKHFTWSNVNVNDSAPVCLSTYFEQDEDEITKPYQAEIFCIETDGIASKIWRFAHNRAHWYHQYFNTQPLGSISRDGRFFLFTSSWDEQVGTESNGTPRSDVWIVKLE